MTEDRSQLEDRDVTYCVNHPTVETYLRCNRCGDPICPKCAVRTEVGYRCRNCINQQQQVFYTGFKPVHYVIAAAVAFPLGLIAGFVIPALGWFSIFLGPTVGLGIAEAAHWAIGRRRGPYTWLVVAACVLVGGLPRLALALLPLALIPFDTSILPGSAWSLVWEVVYLFGAVGSAAARLRTGRRR